MKAFEMSFSSNSFWMFLQTMLRNSSTLGGLGAVTLAASRVVVQIKEAQKLVQLSGI